MAKVRRVRTDTTIRNRLGPELLAELRTNLWAIDCQTCNQPLGRRKPSLTVTESGGFAEVALHHRRCQGPRWEFAARLPWFGSHPSWRSGGFTVSGEGEGLTVFLVNPSCEVAKLVSTDTGWRLASLTPWLVAGMEHGWPERSATLPGLTGSLDGSTLNITFGSDRGRLGVWWCTAPDFNALEIRRQKAVLVGVTTAVDVTAGTSPALLKSLIDRRQVALAWANVKTIPGSPDVSSEPAVDVEDGVQPVVLAALSDDVGPLAALRGSDRWFDAVAHIAGVAATLLMDDEDFYESDGVHIVVPDELTGQHLAELGRAPLESLGVALVLLPAPSPPGLLAVVVGTPEQLAARQASLARGVQLAIVMDAVADKLPPDFPSRYQQVLTI
ncbi:hypothetical protein [Actinomadura terrae]|uniref:hypothetical protein n=1 Tax=Actinomadura terrae TaxID=604353 RepID=UPI001FA763A5|nr:hypothetical protein [Actinomadura terrae]